MQRSKIIIAFFVLLILSKQLYAQSFNPKAKYRSVGASLKTAYFKGDVLSNLLFLRPGLGINFTKRFHPQLSWIAEASWVRLKGDDFTVSRNNPNKFQDQYIRNLNFRNDIKELSFGFHYDLIPNTDHFRKRPIQNVYATFGAALFHHNPRGKDSTGHWIPLLPLKTEGNSYSRYQISLPVGLGFRYKFAISWDLEFEFAYRVTFTDYLDDVSADYINADVLSGNAAYMSNQSANSKGSMNGKDRDFNIIQNDFGNSIVTSPGGNRYVSGHGPGDNRGTSNLFDGYLVFSIRLNYILPKDRVDCPKYRD